MDPDELPDDVRHLQQFLEESADWSESDYLGRAMALLDYAVFAQTEFPFDTTFPNDLAASAGLGRCFSQLRAAFTLVSHGHYAEARNLLRSAYESAGLARVLAKDPDKAAKWLHDRRWFPDREVRKWISESRGYSPADDQLYRDFYKEASAWAHPTAKSCMALFSASDSSLTLQQDIHFDEQRCREAVSEIAGSALFACFAFRNAVVDEGALDPEWRRDLYDLAREVSGDPMKHLDRNWDDEQRQYAAMLSKLRTIDDLDEVLRTHPRSWRNLTADDDREN